MCRLLGAVARNADLLTTVFGDELTQFTALSAEHRDGCGFAYRTAGNEIVARKSPTKADQAFTLALAATRSDAALLHLRKASAGMPRTHVNTHPFVSDAAIAFAHNGLASPTSALDQLLTTMQASPAVGSTDSERFFQVLLTAHRRSHSLPEALCLVARLIDRVAAVESLNCLVLTPDALYALCCYDESVLAANGSTDVSSYHLRYRVEEDRVMVASSGWDQPAPGWRQIANGEVLEIRRSSLQTLVHAYPPITRRPLASGVLVRPVYSEEPA
jgi:predicted glutamine amidotransferase